MKAYFPNGTCKTSVKDEYFESIYNMQEQVSVQNSVITVSVEETALDVVLLS